jgi:hypothetical protein
VFGFVLRIRLFLLLLLILCSIIFTHHLPAYAQEEEVSPITASAPTITRGNGQIVMITISDEVVAAPDSSPPTVECDQPMVLNGNQAVILSQIPLYQLEDGSWTGLIAIDQPPAGAPANPPTQEATPPPEGWATTDAEIAAGKEPDMSTYTANYITALISVPADVTSITLTYYRPGAAETFTLTITVTSGNIGHITLDRSTYPPTAAGSAKVYITVTDPDWNLDPTAPDTIPNPGDATVWISGITTPPTVGPLTEDSENSGTFTASTSLGPPAEAKYGEVLKATYLDAVDYPNNEADERYAYATILPHTASLSFDKDTYEISEETAITLRDLDLNLDSKGVETWSIHVWSTADEIGFDLSLEETGEDTGEFQSTLKFSPTNTIPDQAIIKVKFGGYVYASFDDPLGSANQPITVQDKARIVSHTGTIEIQLGPGPYGTITVTDPDLSLDPEAPDTVPGGTVEEKPKIPGYIYVSSSEEPNKWFTVTVIEETPEEEQEGEEEETISAAVFTGRFFVSDTASSPGDIPTVLIKPGCMIKAVYHDEADETGSSKLVESSLVFRTYTGQISLDRNRYSPGCKIDPAENPIRDQRGSTVIITLTDPDLDVNPDAPDAIPDNMVEVQIERGRQIVYQENVGHLFEEAAQMAPSGEEGTSGEETGEETGGEMQPEEGITAGQFTAIYQVPEEAEAGDMIRVIYHDSFDDAGIQQDQEAAALILPHTGEIKAEPEEVRLYDKVKITLIDPDMNQDPTVAETIPGCRNVSRWGGVDYWTSSINPEDGWQLWLTETGPDTGEFTCEITVGRDWLTYHAGQVKPGDILYFRYNDDACITGEPVRITATVKVKAETGNVELSKSEYPLNGEVLIIVKDPDANLDPEAVDKIHASTGRLTIKTSTSVSQGLQPLAITAVETGLDAGEFHAKVVLNRDIPAGYGDGITVVYRDIYPSNEGEKEELLFATATVKQYTGEIWFNKYEYLPGETVTVYLKDPDLNMDPSLIEKTQLTVKSTINPAGTMPVLVETEPDSGLFKGTFRTVKRYDENNPLSLQLLVGDYDWITAVYEDETADPTDIEGWGWGKPATLIIQAKARIVPILGFPMEVRKLQFYHAQTKVYGEKLKAGEPYIAEIELANISPVNQDITCLIQVRQGENIRPIHLAWANGVIGAGQTGVLGISWTPSKTGTYTIEVYCIRSVWQPEPLSTPYEGSIDVIGEEE